MCDQSSGQKERGTYKNATKFENEDEASAKRTYFGSLPAPGGRWRNLGDEKEDDLDGARARRSNPVKCQMHILAR